MKNEDEMNDSLMAIRYKLVLVGDISVGKTSIMNRYISNEFNEEYDVNINI
jgi:GTPase SAR1 family protein